MIAGQDLSCLVGPSWELYPVISVIRTGERVILLARAEPDWGNYHFVRRSNGNECWAYSGGSQLEGNHQALPVRQAPPPPTRTPTPVAATTLTIHNNLGQTIWYAYISLSSDPNWGPDRLGSSTVPPGGSYTFSLPAGVYDIKLEDAGHGQIFVRWSYTIGPGPTSLSASP